MITILWYFISEGVDDSIPWQMTPYIISFYWHIFLVNKIEDVLMLEEHKARSTA